MLPTRDISGAWSGKLAFSLSLVAALGCGPDEVDYHFVGVNTDIAFTSNLTVGEDPWTPEQPVAVGTRLEIAATARWADEEQVAEIMAKRAKHHPTSPSLDMATDAVDPGGKGKAAPKKGKALSKARPSTYMDPQSLCSPNDEYDEFAGDAALSVRGKAKGDVRIVSQTQGYTSGPGVEHCGSITLIADEATTSRVQFKGSDKDYIDVEWAHPVGVEVGFLSLDELFLGFLEDASDNGDESPYGTDGGHQIFYVDPDGPNFFTIPRLVDSQGRALGIDENLIECKMASTTLLTQTQILNHHLGYSMDVKSS